MKRFVDLLIVVVLLIAGGIIALLVLQNNANNSTTPSGAVGTVVMVSNDQGNQEPPRLSTNQLESLLPTSASLPPDFQSASRKVRLTNVDSVAKSMEALPAASDWVKKIFAPYDWDTGVQGEFNVCSQSIDQIVITISQTPSIDAARAYLNDPSVRVYFTLGVAEFTELENVNGWIVAPDFSMSGTCYEEVKVVSAVFEYWGITYAIDVRRNMTATADQSIAIARDLVPVLIAQTDTLLGGTPLQPTPVPVREVGQITAGLTVDQLQGAMPSLLDLGLTSGTYTLNTDYSKIYTLDEFVQMYQGLNATLASAIDQAGRQYGMVGQAVRLWDPGDSCPSILGVSLEMDVQLFLTDAGPVAYMNDANVQQAWRSTGLLTQFTPHKTGMLMLGQVPGHHCGPIQVVGMMVPYERLLVSFIINSYQTVEQQEVIDILEDVLPFSLLHMFIKQQG